MARRNGDDTAAIRAEHQPRGLEGELIRGVGHARKAHVLATAHIDEHSVADRQDPPSVTDGEMEPLADPYAWLPELAEDELPQIGIITRDIDGRSQSPGRAVLDVLPIR